MEILGKPSINKLIFYIGKSAIVGNLAFVFFKDKVNAYQFSTEIQILALLLLFVSGALVFTISLVNLGNSLRVGLPKGQTKLKTHGLFAITRNPIYLGVYLLCLASCIYVPHWLNFALLALVVVVHHFIILGEERFLQQRFGDEWLAYKKRVRRYL